MGERLLVVQAVDSFTAGPPLGNYAVTVEGVLRPPLQKTNGMNVFQHLADGVYTAQVQAEHYFSERVTVVVEELDPLYPVVIVPLTPKPSYPFPVETTLIRAAFLDAAGVPLSGLRVRGVAMSESCTKAKLAADVAAGTQELTLSRLNGRVRVGERYALGQETVTIAAVEEGSRSFLLTEPLIASHVRGVSLLPCAQTLTDRRGEVALAFGNCRSAAFDVRLTVFHEAREFCREVRVEEGTLLNLRAVNLDDFAS